MIETQTDARRLSSIDAATSLGRLADEVVVALSRRISGVGFSLEDVRALQAAADWLDNLRQQFAKPLDIANVGATSQSPGLYGFGPDVTGVAIDAIGRRNDGDAEVTVLQQLRDMTKAAASDNGNSEVLNQLLEVFESIARAMLSAADSLLSASRRSTWPKTYAS